MSERPTVTICPRHPQNQAACPHPERQEYELVPVGETADLRALLEPGNTLLAEYRVLLRESIEGLRPQFVRTLGEFLKYEQNGTPQDLDEWAGYCVDAVLAILEGQEDK